jgi:hypothetical protein
MHDLEQDAPCFCSVAALLRSDRKISSPLCAGVLSQPDKPLAGDNNVAAGYEICTGKQAMLGCAPAISQETMSNTAKNIFGTAD